MGKSKLDTSAENFAKVALLQAMRENPLAVAVHIKITIGNRYKGSIVDSLGRRITFEGAWDTKSKKK